MLSVIGQVNKPAVLRKFSMVNDGGPGELIRIVLLTLISLAGLYALFNFIFAGYSFLGAGGDSKKIAGAWAKIWQTILGLIIVAASISFAAIIGFLIFGNAAYFLQPRIFAPTP